MKQQLKKIAGFVVIIGAFFLFYRSYSLDDQMESMPITPIAQLKSAEWVKVRGLVVDGPHSKAIISGRECVYYRDELFLHHIRSNTKIEIVRASEVPQNGFTLTDESGATVRVAMSPHANVIWSTHDSRTLDGVSVHDLPDEMLIGMGFDAAKEKANPRELLGIKGHYVIEHCLTAGQSITVIAMTALDSAGKMTLVDASKSSDHRDRTVVSDLSMSGIIHSIRVVDRRVLPSMLTQKWFYLGLPISFVLLYALVLFEFKRRQRNKRKNHGYHH